MAGATVLMLCLLLVATATGYREDPEVHYNAVSGFSTVIQSNNNYYTISEAQFTVNILSLNTVQNTP